MTEQDKIDILQKNLVYIRILCGIRTNKELAELIGISRHTLEKYSPGSKYRMPRHLYYSIMYFIKYTMWPRLDDTAKATIDEYLNDSN